MRIGTWNLEGHWTPHHEQVLVALDCDVWLLTENRPSVNLPGYDRIVSTSMMGREKHWAGILSRNALVPHPDPHAASVRAEMQGITFVCSVLPWPLCGEQEPWKGSTPIERMASTVQQIGSSLSGRTAVWGGDWNQPLSGDLRGFGRASQAVVADAVHALGMIVPTASLPCRNPEQRSIDHIAVPGAWPVLGAGVHPVPKGQSDHDPYWVEVETDGVA